MKVYNGCMNKTNKRNDIFNCALELFSKKGYEAVSPNEIVEKVGVTKPTLYYFFKNKEGLFDEILKENYDQLNEMLKTICVYQPNPDQYEKDVYPVLLNIVTHLFVFAKENTDFYLMSLSINFAPQSSKTTMIAKKYNVTQYQILEKLFCDFSLTHKNIRSKERIQSCRFLAEINSQIGLWYQGHGELNEEVARAMVKGFMHGIFS